MRMGITVDIKGGSHSIEIKSWAPSFEPSLRNIYITAGGRQVIDRRIKAPPPLRMTQRILITRSKNGSSPTIEGDPLTIPFHTLLLNEPGQGEDDFRVHSGNAVA